MATHILPIVSAQCTPNGLSNLIVVMLMRALPLCTYAVTENSAGTTVRTELHPRVAMSLSVCALLHLLLLLLFVSTPSARKCACCCLPRCLRCGNARPHLRRVRIQPGEVEFHCSLCGRVLRGNSSNAHGHMSTHGVDDCCVWYEDENECRHRNVERPTSRPYDGPGACRYSAQKAAADKSEDQKDEEEPKEKEEERAMDSASEDDMERSDSSSSDASTDCLDSDSHSSSSHSLNFTSDSEGGEEELSTEEHKGEDEDEGMTLDDGAIPSSAVHGHTRRVPAFNIAIHPRRPPEAQPPSNYIDNLPPLPSASPSLALMQEPAAAVILRHSAAPASPTSQLSTPSLSSDGLLSPREAYSSDRSIDSQGSQATHFALGDMQLDEDDEEVKVAETHHSQPAFRLPHSAQQDNNNNPFVLPPEASASASTAHASSVDEPLAMLEPAVGQWRASNEPQPPAGWPWVYLDIDGRSHYWSDEAGMYLPVHF